MLVTLFIIALVCGSCVAIAEIISRYRDEPIKAICCMWGCIYIIFNGLLSLAAFAILQISEVISDTTTPFQQLQYAFYAGFGAAIIMRAKLFNFKLDAGEEVGIGPDFVINALLKALDRLIDRHRAYKRARVIIKSMTGIDYNKVKLPIITLLTNSMQSITDAELKEIGRKQADNDATELSNQDKAFALGFMVLNLAGEEFFEQVFNKDERQKYLVTSNSDSTNASE